MTDTNMAVGIRTVHRPSFLKTLRTFTRLSRERKTLANLSTHLLTDIGLTRDDAYLEANRPFLDVPLTRW